MSLAHARRSSRQCLACLWPMPGVVLAHAWRISGACLACLWPLPGVSLAYAWRCFGGDPPATFGAQFGPNNPQTVLPAPPALSSCSPSFSCGLGVGWRTAIPPVPRPAALAMLPLHGGCLDRNRIRGVSAVTALSFAQRPSATTTEQLTTPPPEQLTSTDWFWRRSALEPFSPSAQARREPAPQREVTELELLLCVCPASG